MEKDQRPGIIDTLTTAYGVVNRWPILMVPPIILDLFLWFGPRISVESLILSLVDRVEAQGGADGEIMSQLRDVAVQVDLLSLLAFQTPSIMRLLNPLHMPFGAARSLIGVTDASTALALGVLVLILGVLIASVFRVPIARVVRDGKPGWSSIGIPIASAWWRQILLYIILILGAVLVAVPLALLATVLSLGGLPAMPLVAAGLQVVVLWLGVFLFFVIDAIVLSEVGPIRAVWFSVNVVRRNFWSSLGFMVLSLVILGGLWQVFLIVGQVALGVPLAILGSAYIASGLDTARLLFFRDRLARWQQQQRAAALSHVGPRSPR